MRTARLIIPTSGAPSSARELRLLWARLEQIRDILDRGELDVVLRGRESDTGAPGDWRRLSLQEGQIILKVTIARMPPAVARGVRSV